MQDTKYWIGDEEFTLAKKGVLSYGNIPQTATKVEIGTDITSIGDSAFWSCINLTSITIPNSVKNIYDGAFSFCSNLSSITIPDSVTSIGKTAFYECSNLSSITIPSGVTSIGDSTFASCSNLASIEIPNSVTSIGGYAFDKCSSLSSITIPDGVNYIGKDAFSECSKLSSITIPSGVTSIHSFTFAGCSNLTSIEIPDNVTSIGWSAFKDCNKLISLIIPDNVTNIDESSFENCSSLSSITIPDSVETIGVNSFKNVSTVGDLYCSDEWYNKLTQKQITNLGNVYNWRRNEQQIEGDTIYWIGDEKHRILVKGELDGSIIPRDVTKVIVGNSVTSIKQGAFYYCQNLSSVTLPESISIINDSTFGECKSLSSITIPDGVNYIGAGAFRECSNLSSIIIPDGVTNIDAMAFQNCTKLSTVSIPDSVTRIGYQAFDNVSEEGDLYCSDEWYNSLTQYYIENLGNVYNWRKSDEPITPTEGDSIYWIGDEEYRFSVADSGGVFYGGISGDATKIKFGNSVNSISKWAEFGHNYPNLSSITMSDSMTEIIDNLFSGCTNLVEVNLPESITSIGEYAFSKCSNLSSITIPDSVTSIGTNAFQRCTNLSSLTIGSGVTSIGNAAFYDCESLSSITIPDSVTSIGDWAFQGCSNLTEVTIPDNIKNISYGLFSYCENLSSVNISDGVTSIGDRAFEMCKNLSSITIPNSVTDIGLSAFRNVPEEGELNCSDEWYNNLTQEQITNLGNVYNWRKKLGDTIVTYITNEVVTYNYVGKLLASTFQGDTTIKTVKVGESVTSLDVNQFKGCTSLEEVIIPEGITRIEETTFHDCTSLTSVTLPSTLKEIGGLGTFYMSPIQQIKFPKGLEKIEYQAFAYATGLTSVTLPSSLRTLESGVFSDCSNLTDVTINKGLTTIKNNTFANCTKLNKVKIPATIETIEFDAFDNVPKEGILKCSKEWYDNLSEENITNLGNVYYWILQFTDDDFEENYGLRYLSECVNANDKPVRVEIYLKDYFDDYDEITLLEDGITISYNQDNNIFKEMKLSEATFRYLNQTQLSDLYTGKILDVFVQLIVDDELFWCGYMTPNAYNQPYNSWYDTIEINCIDCLSALQYFDYSIGNKSNSNYITSFADIISRCLKKVCPKMITSVNIIADTIVDIGDAFTIDLGDIFDPNDGSFTINSSTTQNILPYTYVSERNFFDEDDKPMKMKEVVEELLLFYQLTMVQYKEKIIIYDPEYIINNETAFEQIGGLDCGFNTSGHTNCSSKTIIQNTFDKNKVQVYGDAGNLEFGDVFNKARVVANIFDSGGLFGDFKKFETKGNGLNSVFDNGYIVLYRDVELKEKGWWKNNYRDSFRYRKFAYYKTNDVPSTLNWQTYCYTSPSTTEDTMVFTSKTPLASPPPMEKNFYIVISGQMMYTSQMFPYPEKDDDSYTTKGYVCKLKIKCGDKYYGDDRIWSTEERYFTLNYEKNGSKLYDGVWDNFKNEVTYDMGIDGQGTVIPVQPTDYLFGNLEITISDFGRDVFGSFASVYKYVKDFEVKVYQGGDVIENDENNDLVYENVIDSEYVTDFDDVTMKTNTYNPSINRTFSYSYTYRKSSHTTYQYLTRIARTVDIKDGDWLLRPEEVNVKRIVNHYKTPKLIWNDTVKFCTLRPYESVFIPQLDKNMIMGNIEYNILADKTEINAYEV